MKKMTSVITVLFLLSLYVAVVSADRSPTKDTTCFLGDACYDGYGVAPAAGNTTGSCNSSQIGYISWDLSDITQSIGSAQIVLTTYNVTGAPTGNLTFELFAIQDADENWGEDDASGPSEDTGIGVLATATTTLADGTSAQTVTFGGSADTAAANSLGSYFDSKKPGASASVGIRISGGCTTSTVVNFDDANNAGSTGAAPDLTLKTGADFTAVDFYSFRSGGTADMTMIGLGLLVAVGLLVGTGYTLAKRRRA